MTTPRRRIARSLLLGSVALPTIGLLSLWLLLAGSRAQLDGQRAASGLSARVSIERDGRGTVTIKGIHRVDVGYALGYVHAQERFFEMDLMRRMPAGELAALVGKAALPTDLNHRRQRLRAVAEAAYARLAPTDKLQLDRYRDGVNAGLGDLHVRPWEYLLLGSKPQPWKSEDSILVIAAMYLDLNRDGLNERELRLAQMRSVLPIALVDFLLAPDPDWEAPLIGSPSHQPVIPDAGVIDLRAHPASYTPLAVDQTRLDLALAPALESFRPGSNNFAVSGSLTATGAGMLASDMHLGLRVPNIWFRTRLRYPDASAPGGQRDINGVSLPGTPAIVVGSNGQVAWGFTNSYGDWQDWVRVLRDPSDAARYKVPGGWAQLEARVEHIQVKGQPDTLLTIENTRWGPIMGHDTDGTPLALAWIGAQPHGYNLQMLRLERAVNVTAALDLGPQLGMPPQNLVVADSSGGIGWTIAGNSLPLRSDFDPLLPADWSRPGSGWLGWATPAQYPRIEHPADGRLWTANNRTVDGSALTLLGDGGYDLGARAQQIRDDLRGHARFSPGDLLDIQLDNRAVLLTRWQRLLQETLAGSTDASLIQLRQLTHDWRARAAVDSVDYRLVRAFRTQVTEDALAPFVAPVSAHYADFSWPGLGDTEAAVWKMVREQPANLLDPRYASWHALLLSAAQKVATELGRQPGGLAARSWGERNLSQIDHPLSRALPGFLARYLDMPHVPLPGDNNMPRVATPTAGASERLDVAPGHEAQGILEMPGGQSDNPLSPFYGAGHEDWVRGRPTPLLPGPSRHTLTLQPAS